MNGNVEKFAEQVKALPQEEREDFDTWDEEIARDSQPGGRLEPILKRVRRDIAEGRTRPLDEVLNYT